MSTQAAASSLYRLLSDIAKTVIQSCPNPWHLRQSRPVLPVLAASESPSDDAENAPSPRPDDKFGYYICKYCGGRIETDPQVCPALHEGVCEP